MDVEGIFVKKEFLEYVAIETNLSPMVYEAPVLRNLGDIREVTLGASNGAGDSIGTVPNQRV